MKTLIKNLITLSIVLGFVLMGTSPVLAANISGSLGAFKGSPISGIVSGGSVGGSIKAASYSISSASATSVTATTAILEGTISPNGAILTASFQNQSGQTLPGSTSQGITGTDLVPLQPFGLSGLTPSTDYIYTLVVTDGPDMITQDISFTTDANNGNNGSFYISSASASPVSTTTASLNGTIAPNGATVTASFQDQSGQTLPGSTTQGITGTDLVPLQPFGLSGLTPHTNYTYTLVVTDGPNTVTQNIPFTTSSIGGNNGGSGGGGGGTGTTYPYVFTVSSSHISDASATLNGAIDPREHTTSAWFEYSTTSVFDDHIDTTHKNMGSGDERVDLTQNISGLTPNTIYFFRASAENQHGTKKGDVMSFKTLNETSTGIVTTIQATSQLSTSAKFNGIFVNQNNSSAQGYFEYGKTSNLGSKTSEIDLGTSSSKSFSNTKTGLTPDTIYYFRAVAEKDGVTYTGKILVFKTKAVIVPVVPTTPTPTEEVIPEEVIEVEETNIESSIFTIATTEEATEVGKEIEYTVTFQNNSPKNFENTVIAVQLPDAVDFLASDSGVTGENNTVVFNIGMLAPSQTGTMKIIGTVNSKAADLGILVTTAIMSYLPEDSELQKDEIAYVTNKINPASDLGAASIWGNKSFLPSGLIGWIAVILVVLGFILIGKNLYAVYAYKKNQNQYGKDTEVNLENIDLDSLPR